MDYSRVNIPRKLKEQKRRKMLNFFFCFFSLSREFISLWPFLQVFFFLGSLAEIIVVVCRNVARMAAVIFMIKCLKLWRFKLQKIRLFLIVTISTWVVFPWLLSWDHRCRLQKRGSNDSSYLHDKVLKIVKFWAV